MMQQVADAYTAVLEAGTSRTSTWGERVATRVHW